MGREWRELRARRDWDEKRLGRPYHNYAFASPLSSTLVGLSRKNRLLVVYKFSSRKKPIGEYVRRQSKFLYVQFENSQELTHVYPDTGTWDLPAIENPDFYTQSWIKISNPHSPLFAAMQFTIYCICLYMLQVKFDFRLNFIFLCSRLITIFLKQRKIQINLG